MILLTLQLHSSSICLLPLTKQHPYSTDNGVSYPLKAGNKFSCIAVLTTNRQYPGSCIMRARSSIPSINALLSQVHPRYLRPPRFYAVAHWRRMIIATFCLSIDKHSKQAVKKLIGRAKLGSPQPRWIP